MHPDVPVVLRVGYGGVFMAYPVPRRCNTYRRRGERETTSLACEDTGGGVAAAPTVKELMPVPVPVSVVD